MSDPKYINAQATMTEKVIEVTTKQLPLYCPTPRMSQWNSHPRVFIPLKKAGGTSVCPYCGTVYQLKAD